LVLVPLTLGGVVVDDHASQGGCFGGEDEVRGHPASALARLDGGGVEAVETSLDGVPAIALDQRWVAALAQVVVVA
jgi:hypothetical protein